MGLVHAVLAGHALHAVLAGHAVHAVLVEHAVLPLLVCLQLLFHLQENILQLSCKALPGNDAGYDQ